MERTCGHLGRVIFRNHVTMTASRKSCALLLLVVLGMLSDIRAEALKREKRSLPAWILAIAGGICGGQGMAAAYKMWDAYQDMRNAGWRNCDKYFHCRGNYEAARTGWCGRQVAAAISNAREWVQGGGADSDADQEANRYGRDGGNCAQRYILGTMGRGPRVECSLPRHLW